MAKIDAEQRNELELMIWELETENANLQVILAVFPLIEKPPLKVVLYWDKD